MTRSLLAMFCLVLIGSLGCGPSETTPPVEPAEPPVESADGGQSSGSMEPGEEAPGDATQAAAEASGHAYVTVSESDFQQVVLESSQPVLVDIWAPWCGPCLQIAPAIEELAAEYRGRAIVAKLNYDENQALARQYVTEGIPTLVFFKDGQLVETLIGARPKGDIAAQLDAMLADR